jgi:hypothetical protein
MKGIQTLVGGLAVVLPGSAVPAIAQYPGGFPRHRGPGRECEQQLIASVGLTDAQ